MTSPKTPRSRGPLPAPPQPAPEPPVPIQPSTEKVREPPGNLASRERAFARRTGSKPDKA